MFAIVNLISIPPPAGTTRQSACFKARQATRFKSKQLQYSTKTRSCLRVFSLIMLQSFVVVVVNRDFPIQTHLERYERFGSRHAGDMLYFVVKQLHKMLIIACIELYKHRVGTGSEMTLHHFLNLLKFGHYVAIHWATLEFHSYVGASGITEHFRVHVIARASNELHINHSLNALMNSRTRHTALKRHIFRWDSGVAHYDFQYLFVEIVNLFHILMCVKIFFLMQIYSIFLRKHYKIKTFCS